VRAPRVAVLRDRRPEPQPAPAVSDDTDGLRRHLARSLPVAALAPVPAEDRALLDQAIALVASGAAALAAEIDPADRFPVDLVLSRAREMTEQVLDILGAGTSAEVQRINAAYGEVLDLIMLMQLERGPAPADDTLTMILQLRRDLETLRAS
jgi:hypothetical protein